MQSVVSSQAFRPRIAGVVGTPHCENLTEMLFKVKGHYYQLQFVQRLTVIIVNLNFPTNRGSFLRRSLDDHQATKNVRCKTVLHCEGLAEMRLEVQDKNPW